MALKYKPAPERPTKPAAREIYARLPFVSTKDPSISYRTTVYTDGTSHCLCEDFRYHGEERECKHILLLRQPTMAVRIK